MEKKNVIIPFKHVKISNIYSTVDSLYLKLARASSQAVLETVHVIYDFIDEMNFCWHHYRYGFLESVRISKKIISQICIPNKI